MKRLPIGVLAATALAAQALIPAPNYDAWRFLLAHEKIPPSAFTKGTRMKGTLLSY
jgi:hypothetical protein